MSAEQDRPVANGQSAIYPSLAGKRVFLTGGGGGIGASMTRAFSQQGARVAFVDVAEEPSVALVRELEGGPGAPSFRRCDLTDVDDLEAAIADAADAMGGIDILINNAANDDRHTLDDVTPKDMSLDELAVYYSIVSGLTAAFGTLASGQLVDRLGTRDRRMYGFVPAGAFILAAPFFAAGVGAGSWPLALLLLTIPFASYAAYLAPALATVQNRVPPSQRSMASAILLFFVSIMGLGGGPVYIGILSDAAEAAGFETPLQTAMFALTPIFLLAALAHLGAARALGAEARSRS